MATFCKNRVNQLFAIYRLGFWCQIWILNQSERVWTYLLLSSPSLVWLLAVSAQPTWHKRSQCHGPAALVDHLASDPHSLVLAVQEFLHGSTHSFWPHCGNAPVPGWILSTMTKIKNNKTTSILHLDAWLSWIEVIELNVQSLQWNGRCDKFMQLFDLA
jgi:hypothetical protein